MDRALQELCAQQDGLVSRNQLLSAGLTSAQAWQKVRVGRWQRVRNGVYATFTGNLTARQELWSALLAVGPPVAASHRTALWLDGLTEQPPDVVQVSVPANRTITVPAGVRVHRRRDFDRLVRPAACPPRLRFEASLLDAADLADTVEGVLTLVFAATQQRFTTVTRLRHELAGRPRHRWRRLLGEVLADVAAGVASPLERRYLRDVERPHGLPIGERNRPERNATARARYTDVRYPQWSARVELDGRGAHPVVERHRDWRRDNRHIVADEAVLRYGWHDVAGATCLVARQVATVLAKRGWRGRLRRCPRCPPP